MPEPSKTDTVILDDGRVDLPTRRVQRQGASSTLTTLEARLLGCLAAHPGAVVTRDTLLEEVWGYRPGVETRAVDQAIWRLRVKLERDPRNPRHVMTAHGTGYVFEPPRETAPPPRAPSHPPGDGGDGGDGDGGFFGRERELAEMATAFAGEARMIALVGPGGAGKTRLATELGFRWAGRVVICDLSHARSAGAFLEALARALDVTLGAEGHAPPRDGPRVVLDRALADLGPALVILDNLDEATGDEGAGAFLPLATRWLSAAPEARFVVTTRHELFPDAAAHGLVERRITGVGATSAAALFRARAAAAMRRRLDAVDGDPAGVAALVESVDHLPLAIELAAARTPTMSVDAIAAGLGVALPRVPRRPHDAGRRSVDGTLAWSWSLLTPDERAALCQLGVFVRGADLEAADAVVELTPGAPPVSEVLDRLADAALLKRRDHGEGRLRFALLESVADFVDDHLAPIRALVEERHRRYFLGAGERAASALRGPHQADAMAWLVREEANLLAAARRAADVVPVTGARLALVVEPVLARQGPYERHREVLDLAVTSAVAARAAPWEAEARLRRSEARRAAGERAAGRADLARARELAQGLGEAEARGPRRGEQPVLSSALHTTSLDARAALLEARYRRHDATAAEARAAFDEAVALAEACGAPATVADARRERGTLLLEVHAFAAARVEYEAALASYRAAGDAAAAAWTSTRLATVTLELGDHDAAEATFREALEAHDAVGDRRGHAVVLSNLAVLDHEEGRLDRAEAGWRAATAIHSTLGDARFVGFGLAGLGWLAVERGDHEAATRLLEEAGAIFSDAGDTFFEAVTEARRAVARRALGDDHGAARAFAAARGKFEGHSAWAVSALALHERLAAALARPPDQRPAPPAAAPGETSFERAARRVWARAVPSPCHGAQPPRAPS